MKFYHGTTYYSHINPIHEIEANLAQMKSIGFNVVRTAEILPGWENFERVEGRLDFEILDDFVDKCECVGLEVIMGLGVNAPPPWLFEKYPDVRFVNMNGYKSNRRIHSACIDHEGFREETSRFVKEFVTHYSEVSNIIGWQFGNEVRYGNRCVCPSTSKRFREWVHKKYHTLDGLNEAWGTNYSAWSQVYAYCSQDGPPTYGIQSMWMDYRRFLSWSLAEFVEWGKELIKEISDKPVMHNNNGLSGQGYLDYWLIGEKVDIQGVDVYPQFNKDGRIYNSLLLDVARSSSRGKTFWVLETQAGQYGTYKREAADPVEIELNTLSHIGTGSKGILYFRWKSPSVEQPHKYTGAQGFLRPDGTRTKYLEVAERISTLIKENEKLLVDSKPIESSVGIYYPEESMYLGEEARFKDEVLSSLKGIYEGFLSNHIQIDFLRSEDIIRNKTSQYKLIYIPFSPVLPRGVGKALKEWVSKGGYLVSEARLGYVDEAAKLYKKVPGDGLDEVFGACEEYYNRVTGVSGTIELSETKLELILPETKETLRCTSGTIVGRYSTGEIFAVKNRVGSGQTLFIGGTPSLIFAQQGVIPRLEPTVEIYEEIQEAKSYASKSNKESFMQLLKIILDDVGIEPPLGIRTDGGMVIVKVLEDKDGYIFFILNYGYEKSIVTFDKLPRDLRTLKNVVIARVGEEGELIVEGRGYEIVRC